MTMFFLWIAYFLSADLIDYDGKTLSLSDHFTMEHPLGHLSAEKATLTNLESLTDREKTRRTNLNCRLQIQLEKNISLESCHPHFPIFISSEKARCDLPPKNIFSTLQFQEIEFFENVKIKAQNVLHSDIIATGGSAIYKHGKLYLYPSPPKSHCQLQRDEDWIHAEKILFDGLKMEMICFSPHGYFHENSLSFSADSARISLTKDLQPTFLLLEGHVTLKGIHQNKETFALADELTYKADEKEVILTANPSRKVLFWQKDLELSAPQLRIKDAIKGVGDIHFTLNLEEKKQLQTIFSKYL